MVELKLPDLGEGIHEGEIVQWHAAEGQTVEQDAPLVDVLTDKATVTIPCPVRGLLVRQGGPPGAIVKVGQVLAALDTGDAHMAQEEPPKGIHETLAQGPVPAAPATRRLAREQGIDLTQVEGTGPGGRVTPEDLKAYEVKKNQEKPVSSSPSKKPLPSSSPSSSPSPSSPPEPAAAGAGHSGSLPLLSLDPLPDYSTQGPVEVEPLRGVRRLTARRMVTASLLVPHVAHFDEADVTELEALRKRHQARLSAGGGPPLSLLPFALKAVLRALVEHPKLNASVDLQREQIVYKRYYNLGVAVASPRGLIVPVVKAAERRSVIELAAEVSRLAEAARDDKLDPAELRGGTFTVTNIGSLGGLAATPIVNYPEVAILALARAQDRPVVRSGQVVVRRLLPLVLSFDHRLIDGADAARFVNLVKAQLEDPEALLLGG